MNSLNFNLAGKNILVTGGGGIGVGAGICKVLSSCGATVILNELKYKDAESASEKYENAIPVAADIRNIAKVEIMFEEILQQVDTIHGLVNNAGVGIYKMIHEASEDEFDKVYETDVKGLWNVSKLFTRQLIDSKQSGNIVNISSVHAHSTWPGYGVYASAKSAVEGFTKSMAVEYGPHNIRVNAVGPGYVYSGPNNELISNWAEDPEEWIKTYIEDYQALAFEITPEDCGNAVAFLLSDLSRAVTGQTLYVDNGTTSMMSNYSFIQKK